MQWEDISTKANVEKKLRKIPNIHLRLLLAHAQTPTHTHTGEEVNISIDHESRK